MGTFCIRGNLPGMVGSRIKMDRGNIITSLFKNLNKRLRHQLRIDLKVDEGKWHSINSRI